MTVGLIFAHATNNLINDLTDYWKGVDEDNYFRTQYGPQTVQEGFLSPAQLGVYAIATGLAALLVGLPATAHHSFTAEFTAEETATLTGVVTQVWFRNPHVRYLFTVSGEDGVEETGCARLTGRLAGP